MNRLEFSKNRKNLCLGLDIWVTKIVEPDLAQAVLANDPAEVFRHEVGPQEFAALVYADVVQVVLAIGALEQPLVFRLFLLFSFQKFLDHRDQRQSEETGLSLKHILPYRHKLAIHAHLDHFMGANWADSWCFAFTMASIIQGLGVKTAKLILCSIGGYDHAEFIQQGN